MKALLIIVLLFGAVEAYAQTPARDYRSVPQILAIADTLSFDQKAQTAMALFSFEKPDEVVETRAGVTLLFKKYNAKITFDKAMYQQYVLRSTRATPPKKPH